MEKSQAEDSPSTRPVASKSTPKTPTPKTPSAALNDTKGAPNTTPLAKRQEQEQAPEPPTPAKPSKLQQLAQELQSCSWEELQSRFTQAMDERSEFESGLQKETAELLEVFIIWSQTTGSHDEPRAYKRFKTRMDCVQNCESSLEEKKQHYANVVKAFESAMALLRDD